MLNSSTDLLDVNVWVALSLPEHPFYLRAVEYYRNESLERMGFCRTSALGLVRVAVNKNSFGDVPLSLSEAWEMYRQWLRQEGVTLLDEPGNVDQQLGRWISQNLVTPRTWNDAYLAAFAISGGLRLVTFDADFQRFPGLNLLRL